MRIVTSTSAAARLEAARAFLGGRPTSTELVLVGASRGAADDLARAIARQAGSTFGITRFSLTELAARAAAVRSGGGRRVPGTQAGAEAVAARAVFDALAAGELAYFEPVARMPGFPKALARTLHELRLAGVRTASQRPQSEPPPGAKTQGLADLYTLLDRVETELDRSSVDDRAALFRFAADACRAGEVRWAQLPILLLDVPLDSRAEQEFAAALIAVAGRARDRAGGRHGHARCSGCARRNGTRDFRCRTSEFGSAQPSHLCIPDRAPRRA